MYTVYAFVHVHCICINLCIEYEQIHVRVYIWTRLTSLSVCVPNAVMDFFEDDQNSDLGPPDNLHIIPPTQQAWEVSTHIVNSTCTMYTMYMCVPSNHLTNFCVLLLFRLVALPIVA